MSELGLVVIGRNEGDRLRRCLGSVVGRGRVVVYVDSGSTDGSVAMARSLGVEVVELDMSTPFTAARARNAGLGRLLELDPGVDYVQFVDGDCSVVAGWLERAAVELDGRPDCSVVCGRLREQYRDRTIYNRLADLEWDRPAGEALACGGIAMMRVADLRAVGGFDPTLIAGEEPELCVRLRRRGGKVVRLADDMAWHDAAMTRFGQWWRRMVRAGFASAQGAWLHGAAPERHCVRQVRSNWFWGIVVPALALGLAWPSRGLSPALLLGYLALGLRTWRGARRRGMTSADAGLYAAACVVGKLPQAWGQARFHALRLLGRGASLIEYKGPAAAAVGAPGVTTSRA
ncbi:MAG TPA: glycosyltransferase [Isosphaeraceae bacterium]|nr:glycosyltransferase [Isosphaeraceae bacterium]